MNTLNERITQAWYQPGLRLWWLLPLEYLYRLVTALRRFAYRRRLFSSWRAPVPVIVVGNITVGGTGKTPLVIAMAQALRERGYRPGVVSRGYGSRAPHYPFAVDAESPARHSGDEPLLIARATGCPVMIGADRWASVKQLLERHGCDIILTDDGLQHYRLHRDIEIVVFDAQRGAGNGRCLPVGPLREPLKRVTDCDFLIFNGGATATGLPAAAASKSFAMTLRPSYFRSVHGSDRIAVSAWPGGQRVHAVAGIGHPQRFFQTLRELGFEVIEHSFPDHHAFQPSDLRFGDRLPILMTDKDAVKCRDFAGEDVWSLTVSATLPSAFFHQLWERLPAPPESIQH